jgi:hypothetical protein
MDIPGSIRCLIQMADTVIKADRNNALFSAQDTQKIAVSKDFLKNYLSVKSSVINNNSSLLHKIKSSEEAHNNLNEVYENDLREDSSSSSHSIDNTATHTTTSGSNEQGNTVMKLF